MISPAHLYYDFVGVQDFFIQINNVFKLLVTGLEPKVGMLTFWKTNILLLRGGGGQIFIGKRNSITGKIVLIKVQIDSSKFVGFCYCCVHIKKKCLFLHAQIQNITSQPKPYSIIQNLQSSPLLFLVICSLPLSDFPWIEMRTVIWSLEFH